MSTQINPGRYKMEQKLLRRKSTYDVDNAANVITGIIFVAILLAVLLLVVTIIFGLSVFTTSTIANNTTNILNNIVGMVVNFFALMPTVGTILAVVILIAGIVLLVLYVRRMKDSGSSTGFQG
jgi:uncharacterized BrkB/YihY/UPF0761 family membrane protein